MHRPALPIPARVRELPRVVITWPNDDVDLEDPPDLNVQWQSTWKRWDGLPYTPDYADTFTEDTVIRYALLYSRDNGQTWLYMTDDTAANRNAAGRCLPADRHLVQVERPESEVPQGQLRDPRGGVSRCGPAALRLPPVPRVHQEVTHASSETGFSLIEMTVTLAIVSVIMIVTYQLIEQTMSATMFNESHNDLAVMSQKAVNTIQTEVMQARLVFEDDTTGNEYRAALAFATTPSVWTTSLLPVIDPATTTFTPDGATERYTGNSLLLVRQLPPLSILYDHDTRKDGGHRVSRRPLHLPVLLSEEGPPIRSPEAASRRISCAPPASSTPTTSSSRP